MNCQVLPMSPNTCYPCPRTKEPSPRRPSSSVGTGLRTVRSFLLFWSPSSVAHPFNPRSRFSSIHFLIRISSFEFIPYGTVSVCRNLGRDASPRRPLFFPKLRQRPFRHSNFVIRIYRFHSSLTPRPPSRKITGCQLFLPDGVMVAQVILVHFV